MLQRLGNKKSKATMDVDIGKKIVYCSSTAATVRTVRDEYNICTCKGRCQSKHNLILKYSKINSTEK